MFVLSGFVLAITRRPGLFPITQYTLFSCCVSFVACVLGSSFLARRRHQVAALTIHAAATVILIFAFRDAGAAAVVLLLVALELHFALRLPLRWAAAADAAAIAFLAVFPRALGSGHIGQLEVVTIGVITGILSETTIYYRERLVYHSNRILAQSRSLENLAAANQSFVAHLESVKAEAAETERMLITRELHDCVGYALTNIAMMMNAALYANKDDLNRLFEYCRKTRELAATTLDETRDILYRLRRIAARGTPPPRQFFHRLCRDFAEATGVRTDCHLGNLPSSMSEAAFNLLFRAVQVGFINSLRHGNSGHISLSFWLSDQELRMSIWNDVPAGIVQSRAADEGIGLRGIRERLDSLNGKLSYGPISNGYQLNVSIPREELFDGSH